jgi:uncharacterized protein (TIGR00369 family)
MLSWGIDCSRMEGERMNAAEMQRLMETTEPFLAFMGFEVVEASQGIAAVRLPLRREVTNHAGLAHGGAQYALGEATAIAVAATLFPAQLALLDLLTANATITYQRPARGDITARGVVPASAVERIQLDFSLSGSVRFPVVVEIADTTGAVATTLTVECAVRRRR